MALILITLLLRQLTEEFNEQYSFHVFLTGDFKPACISIFDKIFALSDIEPLGSPIGNLSPSK